jgi:hypothetical protein
MTAAAKQFHIYTKENESEHPTDQFYVLSKDFAYGGGGGSEGAGIETYPHMLEALESQLGWLLNFNESHFNSLDYETQRNNLKETIQIIERKGSDEEINPEFLDIDGSRVGYNSIVTGYWPDFAPNALDEFTDNLEYRIEEIQDEDSDDEELTELKEELQEIKKLQSQSNILSKDYVDCFFKLASLYEDRHS